MQKLEAEILRIETQHEAEIKSLQAEIRQLRRQKSAAPAPGQPISQAAVGQPVAQASAGQPAPSPPGAPIPQLPPKVLATYDRGCHFGFSDATGSNTIELIGRLQLDMGGSVSYKPGPETHDQKGLRTDRSAAGAHRRRRQLYDG